MLASLPPLSRFGADACYMRDHPTQQGVDSGVLDDPLDSTPIAGQDGDDTSTRGEFEWSRSGLQAFDSERCRRRGALSPRANDSGRGSVVDDVAV